MYHLKCLKKKKAVSVLGIDINNQSLSFILLSFIQYRHCVEYYHRVELPTGLVNGDVINNVDELSKIIKTSVSSQLMSFNKQIVIAIPYSSTVIKKIQVSNRLRRRDIAEFVMMDVERYISFTRDEMIMDFNVLGSSILLPDMLDILVVVSRREIVEQRVQLVHQLGLTPHVVDVESFAIERAMRLVASSFLYETVAVFNVDLNGTQSFFLHQSAMVFAHEEIIDTSKPAVSKQFFELLLQQFKRALQFFLSTMPMGRIDCVFLVGLGSSMPGLDRFFYERLGIMISIPLFFKEMKFASPFIQEQIKKDNSSLMVACGLALRNTGF